MELSKNERRSYDLYKKGYIRPVVITKYKTIPVFIIKNNLRTAKISLDEYFNLLKTI